MTPNDLSRVLYLGLPLAIALLQEPSTAQSLGPVTKIEISGSSLILSASSDIVVFKACTENILMVNFRPAGREDPDTLVVAKTGWAAVPVQIDTTHDPILLSTSSFSLEIKRTPLRFRLYGKSLNPNFQFTCDEPATGGISPNRVALQTSGGTVFGIHNRSRGDLSSPFRGEVYAGSQGQAGGPFAWTNNGWGFLADADGGTFIISSNSFAFERPSSATKRDLEFYFLIGSPKDIVKGFHEVSGFPPLFPKYSYGFLNTEWGIDQAELYRDIRTYRQKSIPLDAYILDFDWMGWGSDNYGEFRWGPGFPDGQTGAIVDTLSRYGVHLFGIRKPRVHVNTEQGRYASTRGFFVDYVTDYFSGQTVGRINFHIPAARRWFWDSFVLRGNSYSNGITGYWNDEADEYGGNLMFMQMQRAQYEGQRSFNNRRVWSINRNYYSGAQRYAYALWSGDIPSGFSSMAEQRLFMLSSITLGVSWWGMDIGGFSGTPSPENYYRWIQFGTFVPVFRVHGMLNQEREPWNYGAKAESLAAESIRLRYRLMPYIYSAAWENHQTGLAIVRPLVFDYPNDPTSQNLSSEWMFGNSLLVSPVVQPGAIDQSVYLPPGDWLDFHTGQEYSGPSNCYVSVAGGEVPLFVKSGSLVPMSPPAQYVDAPEMMKMIILSSHPGGKGHCTIYDDDGITYDYELGIFSRTVVYHERDTRRALISIAPRVGTYMPAQRDWFCEFRWVKSIPDSVLLDGARLDVRSCDSLNTYSVSGWAFDTISKRSIARFPDDGKGHLLSVHFNAGSPEGVDVGMVPARFLLKQNYPNPFNPTTVIGYQLPVAGKVRIIIFDILGRQVATLVDENKPAGAYEVQFDASGLAGGVYLYRMFAAHSGQAGSFLDTKKLLVLR